MLISAILVGWCVDFEVAHAAVIYSQTTPSLPTGAFSSNDAGNPTDQKIADNFLFNGPGPVTIRSLRFIGGYGMTNPPPSTPPLNALPSDDFRVMFFADSAGAPGTPLASGDFHVGVPAQRTPTGGSSLSGNITPIEYVLNLGTGFSVNPLTAYWISIVNNSEPTFFWVWARAEGVLDQQAASTFGDITTGPWSMFMSGGMFFELSNDNIPEPSSLVAILVGGYGVCFLRKRRVLY